MTHYLIYTLGMLPAVHKNESGRDTSRKSTRADVKLMTILLLHFYELTFVELFMNLACIFNKIPIRERVIN